MKILNRGLLDNFIDKHTDSESALQHWINIVDDAEWNSHNDLKKDFPSADYVGKERYVFNIRGNNYRIVAVVTFIAGSLMIRFIGSHSEYIKVDCKTI